MHLVANSVVRWSCASLVVAATFVACSPTNTVVPGPPIACEDSICTNGNACIMGYNSGEDEKAGDATKQTLKCRLICDLDPVKDFNDAGTIPLLAAQDKCPANYHCVPGGVEDAEAGGGTVSYCVPNKAAATFAPAKGQWGTPCNPMQGFDNNPSCDTANSFWCYAYGPDDGNAICTQFVCDNNGDGKPDDFNCRGGYFCATVNAGPSARTPTRSVGMTTNVCLPRAWNLWAGSYCSPCTTDIDCPLNQGVAQHCVGADGQAGPEKICAVECGTDKNCNLDAKCISTAEQNVTANVCVPRAGTCKGDGSICSPCRSDTDCPNGLCVVGDYTTERSCTVKSTTPCTATSMMCPAKPSKPPIQGVGCFTQTALKDQCVGEVAFMGGSAVGCWTPNR